MNKRIEKFEKFVNGLIVIAVIVMIAAITLQWTKIEQQRTTIELQRNILKSNDCYWTGRE